MARFGRTYTRLTRFIRPKGATRCAPTLVSSASTVWNTATSPKTLSISWSTGDVVVVGAMCSDDSIAEFGAVTVAGLTFTQQMDLRTGSQSLLKVWTSVAASNGSGNLSLPTLSNPNSAPWGYNALVFRNTDGVGNAAGNTSPSGAPSQNVTTLASNSVIVTFNADWSAVDGASRTWRTVNSSTPTSGNGLERDYFHSANYTTYVGYWDDVGAVGAKTLGLSAPTGQAYSIVSIEVKGATCAQAAAWFESWGSILMGEAPHPVAITNLTAGIATTATANTASIVPAAGSMLLVTVTVACTTIDPGATAMAVSGLGGTWTNLGSRTWGYRRRTWLFRGTDVSGQGTITFTVTPEGGGTYQETGWVVDQVTNFNTTTPTEGYGDAVIPDSDVSVTATTTTTPGARDAVYSGLGKENTDDATPEANWGALGQTTTGSLGVRRVESAYNTVGDASHTWSWTPVQSGICIVIVVNVAS